MLIAANVQATEVLGFIPGLPGYVEIIVILLVFLLLFGGKKLPELARGAGRGLRTFRDELAGIRNGLKISEPSPDTEDKQEQQPVGQDSAKK